MILILLSATNTFAQAPYSATYYNPGHRLLSTGHQPKGHWCAAHGHLGERAILLCRGTEIGRFKVLDQCPLRHRIDLPKKTFIAVFGRSRLKEGKIPVRVIFVK